MPTPTPPPFFRLPPPYVCTPETLEFYDSELDRLRRVFDVLNTRTTRPDSEERQGTTEEPQAHEESKCFAARRN